MVGTLFIDEAQIADLLTVEDSITLARDAYIRLANNQALNPERVFISIPDGASVFAMPAYLLGQKTVSVKIARLNPENPGKLLPSVMSKIYVFDSSSGLELAQIEADTLTALRTAASSAVATDLLAGKDSETLGIIGTGTQALAHVPPLLKIRTFTRILVYSRDRHHREVFAAHCSKKHDVSAAAASSPEAVVESADVLVLATNSHVPLFKGSIVRPGTHVNAIGAALPDRREVDSSLVKRSKIIVDSIAQALSSYGDILIPINEGVISKTDLTELGELLLHPSRRIADPSQITLFKSGGLAVLDAALTNHIVSRSLK